KLVTGVQTCALPISKKSLVFFYLNYDNPVSADEYKYALVGCSRLSRCSRTGRYPFAPTELAKLREHDGMQNFGAENWALKVEHEIGRASCRERVEIS